MAALLKDRAADPAARHFCQAIQGFVKDACQAHRQLTKGPWQAQAALYRRPLGPKLGKTLKSHHREAAARDGFG